MPPLDDLPPLELPLSPVERLAALRALIERGGAESVARLADALDDPDAAVRVVALEALARFGPEAADAVPALASGLERALERGDVAFARLAARALVAIGWAAATDEAIAALARALDDPDPDLRLAAVEALASIGWADGDEAEHARALALAVGDEDARVRRAAAFALAALPGERLFDGDADATGLLLEALDDPHPEMRATLCEALGRHAEPSEPVVLALARVAAEAAHAPAARTAAGEDEARARACVSALDALAALVHVWDPDAAHRGVPVDGDLDPDRTATAGAAVATLQPLLLAAASLQHVDGGGEQSPPRQTDLPVVDPIASSAARARAALAVWSAPPPEEIPALAALLDHPGAGEHAASALGLAGEPGWLTLAGAAGSGSPAARAAAASGLARLAAHLPAERAAQVLEQVLATGVEGAIDAAMRAWSTRDGDQAEVLRWFFFADGALEGRLEVLRRLDDIAATAVGDLVPLAAAVRAVQRGLAAAEATTRDAALAAAGTLARPHEDLGAPPALEAALLDASRDPRALVRRAAVRGLATALAPSARERLAQLLADADEVVRARAVEALGWEVGWTEPARAALARALAGDDAAVIVTGFEALRGSGLLRQVGSLSPWGERVLDALDHEAAAVRDAAAMVLYEQPWLAGCAGESHLRGLADGPGDRAHALRVAGLALAARGRAHPDAALFLERIRDGLRDADPAVRLAALHAATAARRPDALAPAFAIALHHLVRGERYAARLFLASAGATHALALLAVRLRWCPLLPRDVRAETIGWAADAAPSPLLVEALLVAWGDPRSPLRGSAAAGALDRQVWRLSFARRSALAERFLGAGARGSAILGSREGGGAVASTFGKPAVGALAALAGAAPDPQVRRAAVDALGRVGRTFFFDREPVADRLVAVAANDADRAVRMAALYQLRGLPGLWPLRCGAAAAETLAEREVALLRAGMDGGEGVAVGEALHAAGPRAVAPLLGRLRAAAPGERALAAEQLARLGESARRAAPGLVAALDDADADVRWAALSALWRFGSAAPPVARGRERVTALLRRDPALARRAAPLFRHLDAALCPAPDDLARLAIDLDDARLASAATGLGSRSRAGLARLGAALDAPDPRLRAWAAESLARARRAPPDAEPRLLALLGDEDPLVRRAAARALAGIRAEAALAARPLVAALRAEARADVRTAIAQALAQVRGDRAAVRPEVLRALLDLPASASEQALLGLASWTPREPTEDVLELTRAALARLGESLEDPEIPVLARVEAAQVAALRLGGRCEAAAAFFDARPDRLPFEPWRLDIGTAAFDLDEVAPDGLVRWLTWCQDPRGDAVARAVVRACAGARSDAAPLLRAVDPAVLVGEGALSAASASDVFAALARLAAVRPRESAEALIDLARTHPLLWLRRHALRALARMRGLPQEVADAAPWGSMGASWLLEMAGERATIAPAARQAIAHAIASAGVGLTAEQAVAWLSEPATADALVAAVRAGWTVEDARWRTLPLVEAERAVRALAAIIDDPDPSAVAGASAAAWALAALGEAHGARALGPAGVEASDALRRWRLRAAPSDFEPRDLAAACGLGALGAIDEGIDLALDRLDEDPSGALHALERMGPAARRARARVEALLDVHAPSGRRDPAARALGAFGDPAAAPSLLWLLAEGAEHEREAAATALGRLAVPAAEATLVATLTADPSDRVRAAAATALGCLPAQDASTVGALAEALFAEPFARPDTGHGNYALPLAAARALARHGPAARLALAPLVDRAEDPAPGDLALLALAAAEALEAMGPVALPALLRLREAPAPAIRAYARRALVRLHAGPRGPWLAPARAP